MVDPVEILNRFTEYNPRKGEEPLPLPIPGHWFRKICALADRIAAAENDNARLRALLDGVTCAVCGRAMAEHEQRCEEG